jgi:hypothetical protein
MAEQELRTDGGSQDAIYRQLESYDWEKDKEFQVNNNPIDHKRACLPRDYSLFILLL